MKIKKTFTLLLIATALIEIIKNDLSLEYHCWGETGHIDGDLNLAKAAPCPCVDYHQISSHHISLPLSSPSPSNLTSPLNLEGQPLPNTIMDTSMKMLDTQEKKKKKKRPTRHFQVRMNVTSELERSLASI